MMTIPNALFEKFDKEFDEVLVQDGPKETFPVVTHMSHDIGVL